jgi:hypothetical protein
MNQDSQALQEQADFPREVILLLKNVSRNRPPWEDGSSSRINNKIWMEAYIGHKTGRLDGLDLYLSRTTKGCSKLVRLRRICLLPTECKSGQLLRTCTCPAQLGVRQPSRSMIVCFEPARLKCLGVSSVTRSVIFQ